jgi:hypothetical protein
MPGKDSKKHPRRKDDLSLAPVPFEEAVADLLKVKPEDKPTAQAPVKRKHARKRNRTT